MTIEKPAPWVGASGVEYTFHVFGPEPDVPPRSGNYIYAKRNAEGAWVPVYMGHGDLATRCADPALLRCIAAKGATHLHLRLNSLESDRESELQDLLAHYANAFAPEGCHPRQTATAAEPARVPSKSEPRRAAARKAPAKQAPYKKASATTAPTKKAPARKASTKTPTVKKTPKTPRPRSK